MGGRDLERRRRELVLAIEVSTYLTIAFPSGSAAEFYAACARALHAILEDIGIAAQRIAVEIAAVRSARLTRLQNRKLREALKAVRFMCGIELMYHSELRRVQANLSEFPHAPPPHYVAVQNARHLFALSTPKSISPSLTEGRRLLSAVVQVIELVHVLGGSNRRQRGLVCR
jgi:hypothetical protein